MSGSFAKETCNLRHATHCDHPVARVSACNATNKSVWKANINGQSERMHCNRLRVSACTATGTDTRHSHKD